MITIGLRHTKKLENTGTQENV